jgi:hypothetical protein
MATNDEDVIRGRLMKRTEQTAGVVGARGGEVRPLGWTLRGAWLRPGENPPVPAAAAVPRVQASTPSSLRLYLVRNAADLVAALLDTNGPGSARQIIEACVRLPARGHRWIAVFSGPKPDTQIWRSTGLTDYGEALRVAKRWEAQARAERLANQAVARPPSLRVRAQRWRQAGAPGPRTQAEVADLLQLNVRTIRKIERQALNKLFRNPEVQQLWREYQQGQLQAPDEI